MFLYGTRGQAQDLGDFPRAGCVLDLQKGKIFLLTFLSLDNWDDNGD